MTPSDVLAAAERRAVLEGIKLEYFSARSPVFRPGTKDWEVMFIHKGFVPDSSISVVVKDANGASCVIRALSSGSCGD